MSQPTPGPSGTDITPQVEDALLNVLQALECIKTTTDEGRQRIARGVWDQVAIGLTEGHRALAILRQHALRKEEKFENTANARLIAAAPRVLDLLQRIARELPGIAETMSARALLNEIEGR